MKLRSVITLLFILITVAVGSRASALQDRFLTPEEVDMVKDAQELDKRIDVFIKAADRRMIVIAGTGTDAANAKQLKKDSESWGELPPVRAPNSLVTLPRFLTKQLQHRRRQFARRKQSSNSESPAQARHRGHAYRRTAETRRSQRQGRS